MGTLAFLFVMHKREIQMDDEYQGGTPSNEALDDDDVSMSPSIDEDTQDMDSGSDEDGDTDRQPAGPDPTVLAKRVQELEERVSGGTRSWQEERAARQQAEHRAAQLAAREEAWRRAGINIEEVDREVQRLSGAAVTQDPQGGQRQPQGVTIEQVQQVTWQQNVLRDWEYEKRSFRRDNPELATPEINRYLDSVAVDLADQELKTYGRIISTPDVIFKKSEAALRKMQADMEKRAARKQSETRQKVKGQGVPEGAQPRRKPSAGETDEPIMTDADYANFYRNLTNSTKKLHRQ